MTSELTLVSAFLIGLLGSVHCLGMCGGIVGALTMGLPDSIRASPLRMLPYLLTYNAGRILSYAIAGALAGFLGGQALRFLTAEQALMVGRIISGVFMILLGLYLGGQWRALTTLENWGLRLWRRIEPWGRRFLPVTAPIKAFGLGLIWGWLPCGLVYAALAFALIAGSAADGAARMLAFGIGTLPMLLAMGAAASWLGTIVRKPIVRQFVGWLIILFGLFTLFTSVLHSAHTHHVVLNAY